MNVQGFSPVLNGTVTVAATGTSTNSVLAVGATAQEILIQNGGSSVAFFRYGITAQTATANDCPILPGAVMVVTIGPATNVAVISPGGTTVYITPGEGA